MPPIETLNGWGAAWASVVVRGVIDSTAMLAVVSIAWLALRRRLSPALVPGLFVLVLIKLALPIPITVPRRLAMIAPRVALDPTATVGRAVVAVAAPDRPARSI